MTVTTMTLGDLCVSPFNPRQNEQDANAVDGLADSLLKRGQIMPLVVHPLPRKPREKQIYGAIIGGRRFRAFRKLIGAGSLPADHPIDVIVWDKLTEGEIVELSVVEMITHVELRPYEVYAAVHDAHVRGRSLAELALANGQTIDTIRQWDRLGSLEPSIFAALAEQRIGGELARAFAATDDHALQLFAWEKFCAWPSFMRNPAEIRKLLKVGDAEQRKLLRFVGEFAYRQAGGRYELDLFADLADERGRVSDDGLLMQLAEAKLQAHRDRLRAQLGRDLRFEASYPRDSEYGGTARDLEITPVWGELTADQEQSIANLKAGMDDLEVRAFQIMQTPRTAESREELYAIEADYAPLEETLQGLEARRALTLPEGDIFCTLVIEPSGELETRFWWASRKVMTAAHKRNGSKVPPVSAGLVRKADRETPERRPVAESTALDSTYHYQARVDADAMIKDEHGLTQDAVQVMRSVRTEILRAVLVLEAKANASGLSRDYLIWSLARDCFGEGMGRETAHQRGIDGFATRQEAIPQLVGDHVKATSANRIWREAVDTLKAHPSMTEKDLVAAFRDFHAESFAWKDLAAALVAGAAIKRTANADGYRSPLHDELAYKAGYHRPETLRALVEPTEAFVELLPRAQREQLARPHVDDATARNWGKLKAGDLVAPVTRALRLAADFVHPLLRFEPPAGRTLAEVYADEGVGA